MRVAWLAPYPVETLAPTLKLARHKISHMSSWIMTLSEALALRPDIELHLVTESQLISESQVLRQGNITFHILREAVPFTNRGWPPWLPWTVLTRYAGLCRRFEDKLREIKPDLVHAHGTESSYALASVRSRLPCLISMQGIIGELLKVTPSLEWQLLAIWEQQAVRSGHYFTCRTKFDTHFVHAINPQARIFMIHEAMNPVFFKNQWQPSNSYSVLFVGSFQKHKGLRTLLEAMAQLRTELPQLRLRVVGGGNPQSMHRLCEELKIAPMVEFLGFCPATEIARLHLDSQLLVLPSELENSPNVLAEAMVSGMPVIATAVGGIPSMMEDGVTGMLVPWGDVTTLAKNIAMLLKQPEERNRLGRNAQRIARERHSPASVAAATQEAYREVIKACQKTG